MNNQALKKKNFKKGENSSLSHGGRIPPHSTEAEIAVLGSILIDNSAIDLAVEKLKEEDFYRPDHRAIYSAMRELSERNEPIDIVTMSEELKRLDLLEQAGGVEYLSSLASSVPSSANVSYYTKIVKEFSIRRRVINEASVAIKEAFETEGNIEEFLNSVEQRILSISDYRHQPSFFTAEELAQNSLKHLEELFSQKKSVTGVESGFRVIDSLTAGFQPSDLIILAARPSMGKTALALSIVQHITVVKRQPVAFFSLEMSKEQIMFRLFSMVAKVPNTRIRRGDFSEEDFPKLIRGAGKIAEAPLYIDDTPALTVSELRAKCRRIHRDVGLSLIVVDYLQLARSPLYSHSREQEISDISRTLKSIAKELNIPVLALSQLNRSVESRHDKHPLMSDLRESGAIEQDADLIMFIYRDEVYNEDTPDRGIAEIIIAKQRNGPTGAARLAFNPEFTHFAPLDEHALENIQESSPPPEPAMLEPPESDLPDDLF